MDLAARKTYRRQLTTLINEADEYIANQNIDINEIPVWVARIEAMQQSLQTINDKLTPTFGEENMERECEKIIEYNDNAVRAIAKLKQRGKQQAELENVPIRTQDGVSTVPQQVQGSSQSQGTERNCSVRLPKLDIIKFDGDIASWPSFWEQYCPAIHDNTNLDNATKFTYLKSYLTGRAAITIAGLSSSQSAYQDAIDLLKDEFANTERIVDTYIQKLMSITPVKYEKDAQGLRKLFNVTATITKSLTSLGISPEQYGLLVKSIVFKALPYNMRIAFNKQKIDNGLNSSILDSGRTHSSTTGSAVDYNKQIMDLLHFLKIELDSLEQANCGHDWERKDKRNHHNNVDKPRNSQFTVAGLFTNTKNCCLFCHSVSHVTNDCDSVLSINEKKNILKQNRLCFRCIKPNHNSKFCKTRNIDCKKCKRRHATSMCDPKYRNNENNSPSIKPETNSTNLLAKGILNNVYLKTACAYVLTRDSHEKTLIRMIIDGGSQLTFIKENLSRQLNLPIIGTHKIAIQAFGKGTRAPARLCNRVQLNLKSQYNDELIDIKAIEVPEICFDSLTPPSLNDPIIRKFGQHQQLADVEQDQRPVEGIELLVGADFYWKLITGKTERLTEDLTAVDTKLGWTIHGSSSSVESYNLLVNITLATVLNLQVESADINVKNFWELETLGIGVNENIKDCFTQDFITNNIVLKPERYEVSLPWKTDQKIDSNYEGALVRVRNITNKLIRNGSLREYDCAVRDYINSDCAELVKVNTSKGKIYYMPHRAVYREDKDTTKLRVVFDASAHAPGFESLNEQLYAGENLVPELLKILLHFRLGAIGIIADIEKAFLQIALNERDRDSHRFLWYKTPVTEAVSTSELPPLAIYRMKRVTFGVTTSPFLLAATLKKHLMEQPNQLKETAKILAEFFYVDDLVLSLNSIEETYKVYTESKEILKTAKMNLRKWSSNNAEVNKYLSNVEAGITETGTKKILGISWHTSTDELLVDPTFICKSRDSSTEYPTKRKVLQTVASIFDPLGMIAPFTVRAKILLQKIWKKKLDWDIILTDELKIEWETWCSELPQLANVIFPRAVLQNRANEVELHVFADASLQAYGAVAYIKCLITNECSYFISKNRVTPVKKNGDKQLSLPKLELTAALCASRLQNYILENISLNVKEVYLWSDSKITLYWIKGETTKREVYVRNRVTEIRKLSKGTWTHCPSKDNPADLLTRGISAKVLAESELWLNGPGWLREEQEHWPCDVDSRTEVKETNSLVSTAEVSEPHTTTDEPIFDLENYEKLEKALRVTALVQRFVNSCRKREKFVGPIKIRELRKAELYWIKYTQRSSFLEEIRSLLKSKELKSNSSILTLKPFLDEEGILRLGGRLQEASLPYETKHPIILPQKSPITRKIIMRTHEAVLHAGVNATLSSVRRRFWILRGRQQIKSTCGKCLRCKRLKGKAGSEPFAPLPKTRVLESNPFKATGVDFAGPLYVTHDNQRKKAYIMLLTCAVVRAVHLELVPDMTTESCVRALRKFMARRGVPAIIYSDNAKTFRRTALEIQELCRLLNTEAVQDLMKKHRIEWKFIVERAAWWGGFWERLVKTVKDALKITLGRAHVNYDELQTILTEVEAAVNSRPLTYIDDDPTNLLTLTPSHFLIGSNECGLSIDIKNPNIKRSEILMRWKNREKLTANFWKKWRLDYLQQLRSMHQTRPIQSRSLRRGDVALLYDQQLPRLSWKLVKIIELFQGRDGRVRACEVQTANGSKLRRPIQLLYPLEVDQVVPGEDVENTARHCLRECGASVESTV